MANSVDPDETPCYAASHLGLYCLLRPVCPNTYGKYGSCQQETLHGLCRPGNASCLEDGPLMWMLPLYLHVNKKSSDDDDDDDDDINNQRFSS